MKIQIKTKGYKIVFATSLTDDEIKDEFDGFLKNVDARQAIAYVEEMSEEEIYTTVNN